MICIVGQEKKEDKFRKGELERLEKLIDLPLGISSVGVCYDATRALVESTSKFSRLMLKSEGKAKAEKATLFRQILERDFPRRKVEYRVGDGRKVMGYSGWPIPEVIVRCGFDEHLPEEIRKAEELGYNFATLYLRERSKLFCRDFDVIIRPGLFLLDCRRGVLWKGDPLTECTYRRETAKKTCSLIYNSIEPLV